MLRKLRGAAAGVASEAPRARGTAASLWRGGAAHNLGPRTFTQRAFVAFNGVHMRHGPHMQAHSALRLSRLAFEVRTLARVQGRLEPSEGPRRRTSGAGARFGRRRGAGVFLVRETALGSRRREHLRSRNWSYPA